MRIKFCNTVKVRYHTAGIEWDRHEPIKDWIVIRARIYAILSKLAESRGSHLRRIRNKYNTLYPEESLDSPSIKCSLLILEYKGLLHFTDGRYYRIQKVIISANVQVQWQNKSSCEINEHSSRNDFALQIGDVTDRLKTKRMRCNPNSTKQKKAVKRPKMVRGIKKKKVKQSRKRINRAKELLSRLPIKKITVVQLPRDKGSVKVKMHTRRMPSRYRRIDLKKPQKRIVKPKRQKKVPKKKFRKVSVKKYTRMVPASYKKRVIRKKRVTRKKTVRHKKVIKKKSEGTIRFTRGVVALLGQIHPGMTLTPKAMKLISAMQSLCTKLVTASQEKAKGSQVTHENIAAAVRSVFPSTMANHAAAEGSKALTCYAAKVSKGA